MTRSTVTAGVLAFVAGAAAAVVMGQTQNPQVGTWKMNIPKSTFSSGTGFKSATVTIEANANEEGHLYGSVGPNEIAQALRTKNLIVDADMVRMEGPIKEIALYEVKMNLGYEIESAVKVLVVRPTEKK